MSYFCKIKNFAYGEINERSISNPAPDWNMCIYMLTLTAFFYFLLNFRGQW